MTKKPDERPIEVRLTEDATDSISHYLGASTKSPTANMIRRTIMETVKLAWANGQAAGRLQINPDMTSIKDTARQVYVKLHANNHTPTRNEIHSGLEQAVRLGIVYQQNKQAEAEPARSESEREEPEDLQLDGVTVTMYPSIMGDEATVVQIDTTDPLRLRINVNDAPVWDQNPETGRDYLARPEVDAGVISAALANVLWDQYGISLNTAPLAAVAKQTAELLDETLDIPGTHTKRSDSEQEGSAS